MSKFVLILLLIFDISGAMNGSISGQLEPDRDLMFSQDYRTKSKIVSVRAYNVETLDYYANNTNLARVVSFDGGGVRGVGPASWCTNFEHLTKKPMADMFNLFAGTSTGGIIATALTMENPNFSGQSLCGAKRNTNTSTRSLYSADSVVNLYINECKNIFKPRLFLGYLFMSKYKTKSAYATYNKYFGDVKLSQIRSDCDLLVTYYNLTNNHSAFFKSHKAKDPALSQNEDFYLKDIIASTTAAPTYFREFKLYTAYSKDHPEIHSNNFISAIDGGVAANDPSACALTEAMSLYRKADAFLLVSMGTGNCVSEVNPRGLISWARNISNILMENTSEMSGHILKKFGIYSNKPVFFSRLQFDISEAHTAMDNKMPANISYLKTQAESTNVVKDKIKNLSAVLKATEKPERHKLTGNVIISESNFMEI